MSTDQQVKIRAHPEDVVEGDLRDDDLMVMFRDGDTEAFEILFGRHHRSVYNFARMMLRDTHRAEDVLQETFLAVVRTAHRYERRGHFRTWLLRVCRNRCLNVLDAQRVRRAVSIEAGLQLVDSAPTGRPPAATAEVDERAAFIKQHIEQLPERQREALALYAFEQMRYRDIAEVLEIPVNTVKTLIRRARVQLAKTLAQHETDDSARPTPARGAHP